MTHLLDKVRQAATAAKDDHLHPITIEKMDTEPGAWDRAVAYTKIKNWKSIGLVTDDHLYEKYGDRIRDTWKDASISTHLCLVKPDKQGDVIADECSIVQVMVELPPHIDAYVVIGSGTLHDIVRFTASRAGKPFLSVPTAPSVDGFTSAGAPIIVRGFKQTIVTGAPIAVFADPDIYGSAPKALVAAGFGDMIGKFTSLLDWKFSHVMSGEPYSEVVAQLTQESLEWCLQAKGDIAAGKPEGLRILMEALLLSGLSMLLFGASHPASGGEHHLSHDWEMELLRRGSRQLLHGAKVGVACGLIAGKYKQWAPLVDGLKKPELSEALRKLPSPEWIQGLLMEVGGPSTTHQLGVEEELLEASFSRAHHHRPGRYTLLKWYNEEMAGR